MVSAARVVTPDGAIGPAAVEWEGGRVSDVRPASGAPEHAWLVPGFVDLQVNGIADIDVGHAAGDDWSRLDALLVAQGVTAWCPTLITAPLASYDRPLVEIAAAAARPGARPAILGAHLEGPFLGGAPGAHRVEFLQPFDNAWLAALAPIVKLVTLAPELAGAVDVIGSLTERGVVVSLGHSTASVEQAAAAAAAGARLVTHAFNGMAPLHHRQPGLLGAALTDDRLAVSLIADLVHVHPTALALAFRAKGPGRTVLVTDAVAWSAARSQEQPMRVVDGAPRLADGTLAGSCLTMDGAIANVVRTAGVTVDDAIRAASTTPADLIGAPDHGRLAVGARADIVALDRDLTVSATWIGGEQVYER
jgi:N-acetylglucosamine-6-phosphate deacetylase